MTDRPEIEADAAGSDPRDNPPAAADVALLREEAQRELSALRGDWAARVASFDVTDAGGVAGEQRSLMQDAVRRFSHNKIAMLGLFLITLAVLLSIFVPLIGDESTARVIDYSQANQAPSTSHIFGTDNKGRDLWMVAWVGGRISLSVALAVSLVILIVGVAYGSIAGFLGGRTDNAMMRILDSLYGLPYLPFAIITVLVVQRHFPHASPLAYMVPALSMTAWFTAARIMRGQMLSLKQNEYVEGALAAGARPSRLIMRHVLPNTIGIMVVAMFLEIPNAILGEAFLSFLGLGVQLPDQSWGTMAQNGYTYADAVPHLIWVPALLIATTVLSTIAVADGLRDAFDPRGREN